MFDKLFERRKQKAEPESQTNTPTEETLEPESVPAAEPPVEAPTEEASNEAAPNEEETISEEDKKAMLASERSRRIGATMLTKVGFESRQKAIVNSSFEQARKAKEKLPGNGNERRNYAYVSRMESLIKEHGNELEKRLWKLSASKLIITPENIEDSYWRSQEQIIRDETGRDHTITDSEKERLTEEIQKSQRNSLATWSEYLGRDDLPFPMWYKIYAWDGMSKMGVFNSEKGTYAKRDEHSIAPYPQLNPAALAKVYGAIQTAYEQEKGQDYTPNPEEVETLINKGDFNTLYSHFLLKTKEIVKTPDRPEDVHGSWVEYKLGNEKALAAAAEGTPWCIVEPRVGRNYMLYNRYGQEELSGGDEAMVKESRAKFILFHLQNPKTGELSHSACASIRLNYEGRVAEISGLKTGQALEDSLVPEVEAKVKTLPGGEKFLGAFADKKQLIALDHKVQKGENLTKEELEFIYEVNHPVRKLDTYNQVDPRVEELREKAGIKYALEQGISAKTIIEKSYATELEKNLHELCEYGANPNSLATEMFPEDVVKHYDYLAEQGATIDLNEIFKELDPTYVNRYRETLYKNGIDSNKIAARMEPFSVLKAYDWLVEQGATIDVDELVQNLEEDRCRINDEDLLSYGADPNKLFARMDPKKVTRRTIQCLVNYGADANSIVAKANPAEIAHSLDSLVEHGAQINIQELTNRLSPRDALYALDILKKHGAKIRMRKLVKKLQPIDIVKKIDTLAKYHARVKINKVITEIDPLDIKELRGHLEDLLKYGANPNTIIDKLRKDEHSLGYYTIVPNLDLLCQYGARIDINRITKEADDYIQINDADILLRHGADANKLAAKMNGYHIVRNLDTLIEHGANIDVDQAAQDLDPEDIIDNIDTLKRHHAKIDDIDTLVAKIDDYRIPRRLETILAHGADVNKVLEKVAAYKKEEVAENKDIFLKYHADPATIDAILKTAA